jgi:hypothetical protein
MWAAVIEVKLPRGFSLSVGGRAARALRYAGVLAVWAGLALVRPRLAWEILCERRAEAPLPHAWPSGLTPASQRKVRALRR